MDKESKLRSLLKGISWRILATVTTVLIVYLIFDRLDLAIIAGVVETISKILLYFIHERIWTKFKFGKINVKPFNILSFDSNKKSLYEVYNKLKNRGVNVQWIDKEHLDELNLVEPANICKYIDVLNKNNIAIFLYFDDKVHLNYFKKCNEKIYLFKLDNDFFKSLDFYELIDLSKNEYSFSNNEYLKLLKFIKIKFIKNYY